MDALEKRMAAHLDGATSPRSSGGSKTTTTTTTVTRSVSRDSSNSRSPSKAYGPSAASAQMLNLRLVFGRGGLPQGRLICRRSRSGWGSRGCWARRNTLLAAVGGRVLTLDGIVSRHSHPDN